MSSAPYFSGDDRFMRLDRSRWSHLADEISVPLSAEEIESLRGLGETVDLEEVRRIYLPISRLLNLYVTAASSLNHMTNDFLHLSQRRVPFIIGVAGSVAVGTPNVQLVTTDGFLYPKAELQRRGIMHRKGFPESYDRRALLEFVSRVKAGAERVTAPKYSHLYYDIIPDERIEVTAPDVLILEGLNVLAPSHAEGPETSDLTLSDFFDFSIYVDARTEDIERWYVDRFLALRSSAFTNPESYFKRYAELNDEQAVEVATGIWKSVNEPNLVQNILPTRARAHLILQKGPEHTVDQVLLRKN